MTDEVTEASKYALDTSGGSFCKSASGTRFDDPGAIDDRISIGRYHPSGSGIHHLGLVRLFLAWVVAADHWTVIILRPRSTFLDDIFKLGFNAGYAVMFFYVVSGSLITCTLTRNYDRDLRGKTIRGGWRMDQPHWSLTLNKNIWRSFFP